MGRARALGMMASNPDGWMFEVTAYNLALLKDKRAARATFAHVGATPSRYVDIGPGAFTDSVLTLL